MGVLQRFERRIESLVNRPFARAFKAEVQPVEVASALQRECDARAAIVAKGRTMVPNVFLVELGPHDHQRLAAYAEPLSAELADMVREHAQEQHYSFIGPVSVTLQLSEELATGLFHIRSRAVAGTTNATGRERSDGPPVDTATATSGRPLGPRPPYVEVNGSRVELAAARTTIGRGLDADLRIDDPGISRRHAELRLLADRATVVDLGSTNGVLLDGRRVAEATLRNGDTIVLGSTSILFRSGEDD